MWVRGLKHGVKVVCFKPARKSHPMWVRGLKLESRFTGISDLASHPMWVRGLKHTHVYKDMKYTDVAPYVGAWIETIASRTILNS